MFRLIRTPGIWFLKRNITLHSAFNTREAVQRILDTTKESPKMLWQRRQSKG